MSVFDRMAGRYDELRPSDQRWWEQFELTGTAGLAAATRLLDVGCGTGRLANAAADRFGLRAWGVDNSPAMIEQARAQASRRVAFRVASADALPFRDGWFDAVTMRLVVHTLGAARQNAFHEAARVLTPDGRLFVWTFAASHFHGFHLTPYLPSLPAVDLARFPEPDAIAGELRAAGLDDVSQVPLVQDGTVSRKTAAERVRAGYISTVHLLPADEVAAAVARLEREAAAGEPDLATRLDWRLLVAGRAVGPA
ncbi:MAG TPA: methyltransferase domain-containing protein [Gaiellales bacterium]